MTVGGSNDFGWVKKKISCDAGSRPGNGGGLFGKNLELEFEVDRPVSGVPAIRNSYDAGLGGETGYGVILKNATAQENFEMISG